MKYFYLALFIIFSTTRSHAAVIVAPNVYNIGVVEVFGPFSQFSTPPTITSMRYQEVYASDQFSGINQGGGFITGVGYAIIGGGWPLQPGGVIPKLQIDLSTTSNGPDGLSTVFAENVGADNRIVVGPKPVYVAANTPGHPPGFSVFIPFDQPFFYDPAQGNLLMDVRNIEAPGFVNSAGSFAAIRKFGDSISSVAARDVAATSGSAGTGGMTTAFVVEPIPEPSTLMLMVVALPLIFYAVRRKQLADGSIRNPIL